MFSASIDWLLIFMWKFVELEPLDQEKKKRINPYQYMEKTKNPDCLAAIKQIVPKLQEQQANILSFIKNIPCLTDTQRKFYDTLLNTRLKMGLLPIYEKHFCDSISHRR